MTIEQVREKFKGAYVARYEKAQKNLDGEYLSHRNNEDMPLVCQELNVLTVEDYDKWYGLYYLMEDPDTNEVMLVMLCRGDIIEGIDHSYYPDSIIKFCIENNIIIDMMSFICINKDLLNYRDDLLEEHLASLHDTPKVVKVIHGSKSRTYYLDYRFDTYYGYSVEGSLAYKM